MTNKWLLGAATTALELSCSLVVLDREWRREKSREKEAERRHGADAPMPGEDGTLGGASGKDKKVMCIHMRVRWSLE